MDISSEMVHALLPVFLVSTLGASATVLGVIEGIAEGVGSVTKVFSGALSDRFASRKFPVVLGYALGALTKPVFALAVTPLEVLGARFVDRIGKGIRGAPRDALVADVTPPALRGTAYGLRQALDTIGAFAGPALAITLLGLFAADVRTVFAIAIVPGAISTGLALLGIAEPVRGADAAARRTPVRWHELRSFTAPFWIAVAIGGTFTLARFSEAFLVLRAQEVGLPLALLPLVLIVMNVVYALAAIPAGSLSDRVDRRLVLGAGLAALIAADLVLALAQGRVLMLVGVGLWGLHMGFTQGLFAAIVADAAPARLRATAFGLFHLISGMSLFLASLLAGAIWEQAGSAATFLCSALLAVLALGGLFVARLRVQEVREERVTTAANTPQSLE
jgi:MFS family permease